MSHFARQTPAHLAHEGGGLVEWDDDVLQRLKEVRRFARDDDGHGLLGDAVLVGEAQRVLAGVLESRLRDGEAHCVVLSVLRAAT